VFVSKGKKKAIASRVRFFSQAGEGQLLIDRLCLFDMFSIPYNTNYNYTKAEGPLTIEARSSRDYSIKYRRVSPSAGTNRHGHDMLFILLEYVYGSSSVATESIHKPSPR
jgi:hypothetical protein